jgi:hypothetical protein
MVVLYKDDKDGSIFLGLYGIILGLILLNCATYN